MKIDWKYGLENLDEDWHSCGAAPPNSTAIANAEIVLGIISDLGRWPTRIAPSTAEAVCIAFENGKRYGDIESYNDGDMCSIITDGKGPEIWQVFPADLKTDIQKIIDYVGIMV